MEKEMDYTTLPKEIWSTIFSFLSCKDLNSVTFVDSSWNYIVNNNAIWKEAVFNDSFPHRYSYSQTDVDWRQLAKRHFVTKRNITNKRCAQFVLGTRAALHKRSDILLRETTVSGKYCMMIWDTVDMHGHSYESAQHYSTELWDTETRTMIRRYEDPSSIKLFNDYFVQENENELPRFTKLDLSKEVVFSENIAEPDLNESYPRTVYNEDPNSSLVALFWTNWATFQSFVRVFDLRTGKKIFAKDYGVENPIGLAQFYGNKIVARLYNFNSLNEEQPAMITEILTENGVVHSTDMITMPDKGACAVLVGNNLWMANVQEKCFIRINMTTMARQQYEIKEDLANIAKTQIHDGLIWLHTSSAKALVYDVSSPTSQLLGQITFPGRHGFYLAQMPNGAFTCYNTTFAHILSFRNEDIEQPMQVLQIEPNGQNKAIDIPQGDLNTLVAKNIPSSGLISLGKNSDPYAVSSQIVFEDENQRYCIIFCFGTSGLLVDPVPINECAERAKSWTPNTAPHKSALFALVHFDAKDKVVARPSRFNQSGGLSPTVRGPCWVFFETKVDGGWLRSSPPDQWHFFKSKLGIE